MSNSRKMRAKKQTSKTAPKLTIACLHITYIHPYMYMYTV